jgi:DNA-directed RNA polymerase specialized sigma24 family protein
MPFTAHDLRYYPEQSYPLLYAYLHRNAQRFLGALKYDAFEVDTVIGHVVEQLVRLGLFGGGDRTSLSALDHLTDAQFYAFLSRSVRNKAIDRLRKRRLQVSSAAELEYPDEEGNDDDPLEGAVESLWGETPFATPEAITLHLVSQRELRNVLKHCISALKAAPNQLQAVLTELQELGADELLGTITEDLRLSETSSPNNNPHMSQHKDHAHRKLRHCLQQQSSNLTVAVALRLTECTTQATGTNNYTVDIPTLAQENMQEEEVRSGLKALTAEGLLHWQGEDVVSLTSAQRRRLARFYRDE